MHRSAAGDAALGRHQQQQQQSKQPYHQMAPSAGSSYFFQPHQVQPQLHHQQHHQQHHHQPGAPAGDELNRDQPLFCGPLSVGVKYPDHEKNLTLTVRVLAGSRATVAGMGGGQREEMLHVELTDELDPFFLHTLQVGEEDYHQLKHDQRLRVDFKAFPRKFIELLESCGSVGEGTVPQQQQQQQEQQEQQQRQTQEQQQGIPMQQTVRQSAPVVEGQLESAEATSVLLVPTAEGTAAAPAFLARLEVAGGTAGGGGNSGSGSTFSVVETNPFKELTHLCLAFRAGNDASIKSYLAARLRQLKGANATLGRRLREADTDLLQARAGGEELAGEAAELRANRERDLRDLRAKHCAEMAALKESALEKAEALAQERGSEMACVRRQAEEDKALLTAGLKAAEEERDELRRSKFEGEALTNQLRQRLEAGEQEGAALQSEVGKLRAASRQEEAERFRLEKEGQRLALQVAALTQQVADKVEMVEKSSALQQAADASKLRLEQSLQAYKANVLALQEKLEASVSEINKGNAIIQQIQAEYRSLKSKARLKGDVIKQQERLLLEQRDSLAAASNRVLQAEGERKNAVERASQLQRNLEQAEGKLEESAGLLESNQQVINWLNKELNEAQLVSGSMGGRGGGGVAAVSGAYGSSGGGGSSYVPPPGVMFSSLSDEYSPPSHHHHPHHHQQQQQQRYTPTSSTPYRGGDGGGGGLHERDGRAHDHHDEDEVRAGLGLYHTAPVPIPATYTPQPVQGGVGGEGGDGGGGGGRGKGPHKVTPSYSGQTASPAETQAGEEEEGGRGGQGGKHVLRGLGGGGGEFDRTLNRDGGVGITAF